MAIYELSNRIYELRKQKGFSQKELGAILGVSNKAVSKWETGTAIPKTETLIKLAEVFEISPEELLSSVRVEEEQKLTTLVELSADTQQLLKKEKLVFNDKTPDKNRVKSAKIYLVGLLIMTLVSAFRAFGIAVSVPDLAVDPHLSFEYTAEDLPLLIISTVATVIGTYSGLYGFFKLIKKLPGWACVLFGILFLFIFGIVIWAGFVMTVPFVIISIKALINAKRGASDD